MYLSLPLFSRLVQDIINIIRLELEPDLARERSLKWTCRLCLTVPPANPHIMPLGQPGILKLNDKMLLFLHVTRTNVQLPPGQEPMSVIIPLVYDVSTNRTTVAQKEMTPVISIANQQLSRLARSGQLDMRRCTIQPSVDVSGIHKLALCPTPSSILLFLCLIQELLYNLSLPNEGPPHQMQQQQHFRPQMMGPGPPQMMAAQMRPGESRRRRYPHLVLALCGFIISLPACTFFQEGLRCSRSCPRR